ncbi:MAG: Crp/Fnr family transcriptional regulator [Prevotella sp.]|nr:Crp/Fnr family transcriptional regulator [Candidatus Prevotella equi]
MSISVKLIESLPLFLGMTSKQLNEIAKTAHFSQRHCKKGSVIATEGDVCNPLLAVMDGWIETDTSSDNKSYHMKELLQGPEIIEPDKLFGLSQHYHTTYRAYTACEIIGIPKEVLNQLFTEYLIVRINLMNLICRKSQILERSPWKNQKEDLQDRIAMFIRQHSMQPTGKKTLYITMTQLASELNTSRLEVSIALNKMAEAERIILKRGIIEVPTLQLL